MEERTGFMTQDQERLLAEGLDAFFKVKNGVVAKLNGPVPLLSLGYIEKKKAA